MSYARQMLDTYPRTFNVDADLLADAIDALGDFVQVCNADNAADLGEQNVYRDGQMHPAVPGLRRDLHRHRGGHQPPDGVRRRCHPAAAGGLRGHLQELRR